MLRPKSRRTVPLSVEYYGKRYIYAQDEAGRFEDVGWVDLEAIAASSTPAILIDGVYVTKVREEVYTVWKEVWEQVVGSDGRIRRIIRRVPEQRVKTVPERVLNLQLKVAKDGEWHDLVGTTAVEE